MPELIKDPYVLEFRAFLMLMRSVSPSWSRRSSTSFRHSCWVGQAFAFVARTTAYPHGDQGFFIDLVFYNYLLRRFVLIDLKAGELTHQDIGQMDMYVRLYEDRHKNPGTIQPSASFSVPTKTQPWSNTLC